MNTKTLITKAVADYALIDSGESDKLERFGVFTLSRPDPQALWAKSAPDVWLKAQGVFVRETIKGEKAVVGSWKMKQGVPERWQISLGGLKFWIKPSSFKHVGIFPEQVGNWDWIRDVIKSRIEKQNTEKVSVLNLFGYTGGSTLAAASAGAEVCHVDGSKTAITWAKDNAEISGLGGKPIRWILDDALTFVKREIKRGKKYDGIIMDPPAFGRGPDGEVWKIEENLLQLVDLSKQILTERPLFFLINGYASGYSALAYKNVMKDFTRNWGGETEVGELAIEEEKTGRLLPAGIFGRWSVK
jgi:23S rRNA (cytosine1962-C5)-methyltransferase